MKNETKPLLYVKFITVVFSENSRGIFMFFFHPYNRTMLVIQIVIKMISPKKNNEMKMYNAVENKLRTCIFFAPLKTRGNHFNL